MNPGTPVILGVFGVMVANQVVMRFRRQTPSPGVFWTLNAINVITGAAVLAFGLPGTERYPILGWIVALLLFSHTLQNLTLRSRWIRVSRRRAREEEEDALIELRRKEDDATEDSTEDTQRKV